MVVYYIRSLHRVPAEDAAQTTTKPREDHLDDDFTYEHVLVIPEVSMVMVPSK